MSKRVILTQDQSAERNSNLQRPSLAKRFGFENDMNERVSDSSFSTIPNTAIQTYRNTSTAEFGTTKGTEKQKESTIDVVKVMNMTMDQRKQGRWLQMFDNKPKGENQAQRKSNLAEKKKNAAENDNQKKKDNVQARHSLLEKLRAQGNRTETEDETSELNTAVPKARVKVLDVNEILTTSANKFY